MNLSTENRKKIDDLILNRLKTIFNKETSIHHISWSSSFVWDDSFDHDSITGLYINNYSFRLIEEESFPRPNPNNPTYFGLDDQVMDFLNLKKIKYIHSASGYTHFLYSNTKSDYYDNVREIVENSKNFLENRDFTFEYKLNSIYDIFSSCMENPWHQSYRTYVNEIFIRKCLNDWKNEFTKNSLKMRHIASYNLTAFTEMSIKYITSNFIKTCERDPVLYCYFELYNLWVDLYSKLSMYICLDDLSFNYTSSRFSLIPRIVASRKIVKISWLD